MHGHEVSQIISKKAGWRELGTYSPGGISVLTGLPESSFEEIGEYPMMTFPSKKVYTQIRAFLECRLKYHAIIARSFRLVFHAEEKER